MAFEQFKPKELNEAAWEIVIDGWSNGLSDREVAFRVSKHTGINLQVDDIRRWVHEDKGLADLRENLSSALIADAKLNVADAVRSGDTATAKWYLERKAQDEFSTKQSIAFDEASQLTLSIEDKQKALEEMIANFNGEE